MNPLSHSRFRQGFAQGGFALRKGIVIGHGVAEPAKAGRLASRTVTGRHAIPSPFLRPGSNGTGPVFWGASCLLAHDPASGPKFHFSAILVAINCPAITTPNRGSVSCAKPSGFWPLSPFLWPAACRIRHRAAWRAPLSARPSRMQPIRIWLQAPHLAASRAMAAARSTSGRPATDLSVALSRGNTNLTAAPRRGDPSEPRAIRASRAGGLFVFAPWGRGAAKEGRRCSRRY